MRNWNEKVREIAKKKERERESDTEIDRYRKRDGKVGGG